MENKFLWFEHEISFRGMLFPGSIRIITNKTQAFVHKNLMSND